MTVFNSTKREINIKIVYYGPALCGKTTNVQYIHKKLAPHQRGDLVSLATKDDRTLFFDFLPIELGNIKGFKTRFHIYTVPGQVYYALTRRSVLTNADGVVFVADSQIEKMDENRESLNDLEENLSYYRKDLHSLPLVMQYNKRDLENSVCIPDLNDALNLLRVPFFEASAVNGQGVMETLTACCKLILKQIDEASAKKNGPIIKIFAESLPSATDTVQHSATELINSSIMTASDAAYDPQMAGTAELISQTPETGDASPDNELPTSINVSSEIPAQDNEPTSTLDNTQPEPLVSNESEISIPGAYSPSMGMEGGFEAIHPVEVSAQIRSADASFKILACGQPQKETASSIKIPLIFKIEELHKECLVNLIIKFDNFTLREPF